MQPPPDQTPPIRPKGRKQSATGKPLTFVLEFHPAFTVCDLHGVIDAVLRKYSYSFSTLIGGPVAPRIAWRNGGQSLFALSRKCWRMSLVTKLHLRE